MPSLQCVRMLCEGNFEGMRELIEARRKHISGLIAKGSKDEEAVKLWEKELRLLSAPDLTNAEHVAIAAGAFASPHTHANPLGRALIGGRWNKYDAKEAAQVEQADKRAIETVNVLLELVPQSIEWLDLPCGRQASAFIQSPSPAIAEWILSHEANPTSVDQDG